MYEKRSHWRVQRNWSVEVEIGDEKCCRQRWEDRRGDAWKEIFRGEEEFLIRIQTAQTKWWSDVTSTFNFLCQIMGKNIFHIVCDDHSLLWKRFHEDNQWKLQSPGLRRLIISSQNVKKNKNVKKNNKKKQQAVFPSTPLRRYFTLVEHFYILAQIPLQVHTWSAVKISSVALLSLLFEIHFLNPVHTVCDNKVAHFIDHSLRVCWLNSENLPPGSETLF